MPWNRIEYHARSSDLDSGLQAKVADPLWFLARQWQFGEFQGEDAGSPVYADISATTARTSGLRGLAGPDTKFDSLPKGPVEASVEAESVVDGPAGARLAADAGLHFLRMLEDEGLTTYRATLRTAYPLSAPAGPVSLSAAAARMLDILVRSSFDARLLAADAAPVNPGDPPVIPAALGVLATDEPAFQAALDRWYPWYEDRFVPSGTDMWRSSRMEYSAELLARTPGGDVALSARAYGDGHLDWSDFDFDDDVDPSELEVGFTPTSPAVLQATKVPVPLRYRGMPVSRFWEFEDRKVYLGDIDAGPTDLIRLMLVEFALLAADDWFTIPLDRAAGSLTRIDDLLITDTFGVKTTVPPATQVDGPNSPWRMFTLTGDPALSAGTAPWLFLAPSATRVLESAPVEEVAFLRDEMANMAWGVERVVEGPHGKAVNRFERWIAERQPEDPLSATEVSYLLSTRVPDHWYPFVPVQMADLQSIRLRRGTLLRSIDEPAPPPQGVVLEPGVPLRMHEEEIPRSGIRVTRTWQMARWHDGSTWLWMGRRKRLGRGERSSNLAFDRMVEPVETQ